MTENRWGSACGMRLPAHQLLQPLVTPSHDGLPAVSARTPATLDGLQRCVESQVQPEPLGLDCTSRTGMESSHAVDTGHNLTGPQYLQMSIFGMWNA